MAAKWTQDQSHGWENRGTVTCEECLKLAGLGKNQRTRNCGITPKDTQECGGKLINIAEAMQDEVEHNSG
jgi:hypothetical protein